MDNLIILRNHKVHQSANIDARLMSALDFVCKHIEVSKQDFVTLSVSNLLTEELDYLRHIPNQPQMAEISKHQEKVKKVKLKAEQSVIK
jgi:hypothetical protein